MNPLCCVCLGGKQKSSAYVMDFKSYSQIQVVSDLKLFEHDSSSKSILELKNLFSAQDESKDNAN